jgi:hypothetical protein
MMIKNDCCGSLFPSETFGLQQCFVLSFVPSLSRLQGVLDSNQGRGELVIELRQPMLLWDPACELTTCGTQPCPPASNCWPRRSWSRPLFDPKVMRMARISILESNSSGS